MIKTCSITVHQIIWNRPVGYELTSTLDQLNSAGCEIVSIHETKVNTSNNLSDQGFIVIYKIQEDDIDYAKELDSLTICLDRYGGLYSGGKYTAWYTDPPCVPKEINDRENVCEPFWLYGVDDICIKYGVGDTIDEAVHNLYDNIQKWRNNMPNNIERND